MEGRPVGITSLGLDGGGPTKGVVGTDGFQLERTAYDRFFLSFHPSWSNVEEKEGLEGKEGRFLQGFFAMQSCAALDLEGIVRHHDGEHMNGKVVLGRADLFGSNEEDEEEVLKKQIEDIRYVRSVLQDESTLFSRMVNVYGNIVDSLLMESIMQARCCVSKEENGTKPIGATRCAERKSIRRGGNGSNARTGGGTKYNVDVFGQDVRGASVEPVECRHCGRRVSANRFVPHLEKCSGREVFGAEYGTKRRQSSRGRYS